MTGRSGSFTSSAVISPWGHLDDLNNGHDIPALLRWIQFNAYNHMHTVKFQLDIGQKLNFWEKWLLFFCKNHTILYWLWKQVETETYRLSSTYKEPGQEALKATSDNLWSNLYVFSNRCELSSMGWTESPRHRAVCDSKGGQNSICLTNVEPGNVEGGWGVKFHLSWALVSLHSAESLQVNK